MMVSHEYQWCRQDWLRPEGHQIPLLPKQHIRWVSSIAVPRHGLLIMSMSSIGNWSLSVECQWLEGRQRVWEAEARRSQSCGDQECERHPWEVRYQPVQLHGGNSLRYPWCHRSTLRKRYSVCITCTTDSIQNLTNWGTSSKHYRTSCYHRDACSC